MSFGKLYTYEANPRSTAILAVAKANGLDLEVVNTDPATAGPEYLKYNKLGKVPTFVGADGYVLHECIAIAIYGTFTHLLPYTAQFSQSSLPKRTTALWLCERTPLT
jgi:elongation factor 1-gamma